MVESANLDPDQGEAEAPARRVLLVAVIAMVAALLAALAAPGDWGPGAAELRVRVGDAAVELPVTVGATEALSRSSGALAVVVPDGVPLDGAVRVLVSSSGASLALADVEVRLEQDGESELLPVVRVDDEGRVVAERRPPRRAGVVLGLLAFVAVFWVTGALPLHVPSLLVPVVLTAGGVATATESLAPFFHPIIALFFAGFLMARAMQRVGLDLWVASQVVSRASRGPGTLYVATIALAAFLSMWMSNTAAVAVLIPVALAIAAPLGSPSYERALVLGLAYAATVGGVGSAIGTPANQLAIEFLGRGADRSVDFVGWFAYGLPMVLVLVPVIGAWVWWRGRVEVDASRFDDARRAALQSREAAGRLDADQVTVLVIFLAVVIGWLTQAWHQVDTGIVALAGAVALTAVGRIRSEDLGRISWSSLLTFGGGLTLGLQLASTGVADWVATRLVVLGGLPTSLGVLVVAAVVLVMTTLASNTATAAVMIPLAIPLSAILGVDPTLLVVTVAIASSVDFALVIGTPPTMLAHATGLFSTREIFQRGVALDLLGLLLLVFVAAPLWRLLGVV